MEKQSYLSPEIDVIEIALENGFAMSQGAPISDWDPENM